MYDNCLPYLKQVKIEKARNFVEKYKKLRVANSHLTSARVYKDLRRMMGKVNSPSLSTMYRWLREFKDD